MRKSRATFSDQIIARRALSEGGGSGNTVERVSLRDGRDLICKRVSPEWDWISRATNDDGRALFMWTNGLFDRFPAAIDHATVAVEADDPGWTIFMRDVSEALVPSDHRLDRASARRILSAMAELHLAFWGEHFPSCARSRTGTCCSRHGRRVASNSAGTRSARSSAGAGRCSASSSRRTSRMPSLPWPSVLRRWPNGWTSASRRSSTAT